MAKANALAKDLLPKESAMRKEIEGYSQKRKTRQIAGKNENRARSAKERVSLKKKQEKAPDTPQIAADTVKSGQSSFDSDYFREHFVLSSEVLYGNTPPQESSGEFNKYDYMPLNRKEEWTVSMSNVK